MYLTLPGECKMVKKKLAGEEVILLVEYLERLLNWNLWIDKAEELLAGSRVLEPRVRNLWNVIKADFKEGRYDEGGETPHRLPQNLQGPYFMLIAYALENLFKAMIIWDCQDTLRNQVLNTGKLPVIAKNHDLIRLAKEAHFMIDVGDEDLLTRLHWNSVWAGRYPVPVDCGGLKNVKVYSDGKGYLTAYFSSNDIDRLNALVKRVKTHVRNALNFPAIPMSQ